MKINSSAGFEQYQAYVQSLKNAETATTKTQGGAKTAAAANTDKVTFSEEAAARAEISRAATAVSAEVDSVDAARLAQLREQVQSGTYSVEAGTLADAILGRIDEE